MNTPVKILLVEDSEDDAILAVRALRSGGFDPTHRRVQTAAELKDALAQGGWDAVISDFSMPGFTGVDALRMVTSTEVDIPFILISGTIGEEIAVNALKAGASDYIMKNSLARLAPALERELKESRMRAAHRQLQRELIESEERFRSLTALSSDWSWEQDENFRFTQFSAEVGIIFGEVTAGWIGKTRWELPYRDADWTEHRATLMARKAFRNFDVQPMKDDGNFIYASIGGEPKFDADGRFLGYRGVGKNVTERREAANRISRLNRVLGMLSGINTLIVRVRNREELFREACRIAVDKGGFLLAWIGVVDRTAAKLVPVASAGTTPEFLACLKQRSELRAGEPLGNTLVAHAIRENRATFSNDVQKDPKVMFKEEHRQRGSRSMAILPLQVADDVVASLALYSGEAGFFDDEEIKLLAELAGNIAFAIDHIGKQERLNYLAYYDVLTGLANRSLFLERVAQYQRSAISGGHKLAVFLVDLERFKNINDSLGQPAGDALLRQVAEWLTSNLGDANLLARMDADHFAVVLPEVRRGGDVARLLENTMAAFLEHPFRLDEAVFRIAARVGVALFPEDGATAETLFRNAEAALKKAKSTGERYLFYKQTMTESTAGKLTLENQLRQALDRGEFVLHYQPKLNLASGAVTSAEALIRWTHPRTGLVPPGRFIPILEETGLIHDVGRWALRQAIADYLRWRAAGLRAVRIAVNLSPLQLRHRDFIAEITAAIGIDAHAAAGLELELTESLIMADVKHSIATLQAIRAMGVTIAIDDFGTGFSSLSYLAKLPVDTLKIDRSFVTGMTASPEGLALVSTIIKLAHSLKLKAVAEGVETEEQSRLLRLLGCDEMQGFLFSKAVPSALFESRFLSLARPADLPGAR